MTQRKQRIVISKENNLRQILKEKGMLQVELADIAVGGNTQLINRIIKGQKQGLTLAVAMSIADAVCKPVEEIFSIPKTDEK